MWKVEVTRRRAGESNRKKERYSILSHAIWIHHVCIQRARGPEAMDWTGAQCNEMHENIMKLLISCNFSFKTCLYPQARFSSLLRMWLLTPQPGKTPKEGYPLVLIRNSEIVSVLHYLTNSAIFVSLAHNSGGSLGWSCRHIAFTFHLCNNTPPWYKTAHHMAKSENYSKIFGFQEYS